MVVCSSWGGGAHRLQQNVCWHEVGGIVEGGDFSGSCFGEVVNVGS